MERPAIFLRAVDPQRDALESYVTKKPEKEAALGLMKKALMNRGGRAEVVTDGHRRGRRQILSREYSIFGH